MEILGLIGLLIMIIIIVMLIDMFGSYGGIDRKIIAEYFSEFKCNKKWISKLAKKL